MEFTGAMVDKGDRAERKYQWKREINERVMRATGKQLSHLDIGFINVMVDKAHRTERKYK